MNSDYAPGQATAESAEPAAAASEESAPPATGGEATTSHYADAETPQNPAWAAPAAMNPEYNAGASPAAQPSTTATEPAATQARDAAVEACRDAVTAAVRAAKFYFAEESYDIAPNTRNALRKVAAAIKDCRDVVVEVNGHTDSTGTPDQNQKLSEQRAKAVVDFLAAAGVDVSKLRAIGFGQDRPITTNSTPEGRRMNRRIEFFISGRQ
jgi:outer membrane protein OmpA-like peptidoglycan-associated protein